MATLRGTVLAFGLFAGSFALHVVAGATDQDWLFAAAVVLIYLSATGFAGIAALLTGWDRGDVSGDTVLVAWGVIGVAFTSGALWAANGRAFAWWEVPLALVLETVISGALLAVRRRTPASLPG
jgi:hypothetical protein